MYLRKTDFNPKHLWDDSIQAWTHLNGSKDKMNDQHQNNICLKMKQLNLWKYFLYLFWPPLLVHFLRFENTFY